MSQRSNSYMRPPDHYERTTKIMQLVVAILGYVILTLCLGLALRILWWTTEPQLLARNNLGQDIPLIEITGKPDPKVSLIFVTDLISEGFNFTHGDFQTVVPSMRPYFIGAGYDSYIQTLRSIGVADHIQQGPLVLVTDIVNEVQADPEETGKREENFVWVYKVKLSHTIRTTTNTQTIEQMYKITLLQMPVEKYPFGVAIHSIQAMQ